MPQDDESIANEIEIELTGGTVASGAHAQYTTAHFKRGRRKWRSGRFVRIFDPHSGEVKSDELKLGTWTISPNLPNLITLEPDWMWRAEGTEIELLRHFLNENLGEGSYKLVKDHENDVSELIAALAHSGVDAAAATQVILKLAGVPGLAEQLAGSDLALSLSESIELQRRRGGLEQLAAAVDAGHNETQLYPLLKGEAWIFGGQFVGEAARRQLTIQSTVDIPLLRGDGSLHIVELKGPRIPVLVEKYRGAGYIVGPDVNRAVGQAQNYLRDLDENAASIAQTLDINSRRATATVVIGDSRHVTNVDGGVVMETFRVYNSHLSRVQVMTYDELVANAKRSTDFQPRE